MTRRRGALLGGDRPRVLYWNSQPTPYMVARWNAVVDRGNLEMHAWFNVEREPDRSWQVNPEEWRFEGSYLRKIGMGRIEMYLPPASPTVPAFDLVVQEYASPSMMAGYLVNRGLARRVAFRALPTFDRWVRRNRLKEIAKTLLFRSVDAIKTPGPDGEAMILSYGVKPDRIFHVTQSVNVELFSSMHDAVRDETRQRVRTELALSGCTFVFVGRIWSGKGLDTLFEAYARLASMATDISLVVVGDGVDEARYRSLGADTVNVHFLGFKDHAGVAEIYAASDVMVFPTLGDPHGLVVEEAMASGLPVIVSSAAGDIRRRVPEGIAGFVVPPDDPQTLFLRMQTLAADANLRKAMGRHAAELAGSKSNDTYAVDFERFVFEVLSMEPNESVFGRASRVLGKAIERITRPVRFAQNRL